MKIAISGKGGVGKTLLSSFLVREFASHGYIVLAIDADPDTNLASALGFQQADQIVPISEMSDLIEERTGAKPGQPGSMFKLNPKVDDIPEKYALKQGNIRLMVMGRVKRGGSGCYCSENTLLQALIAHLLVARNEVVILDMAAGIEHLGRATARAVDKFIVVVEPGSKSIDTALRIKKLAQDIGVINLSVVGNKIRTSEDMDFIRNNLPGFEILGFIPYDTSIIDADISRNLTLDSSARVKSEIDRIYQRLIANNSQDSRSQGKEI